VRHGEREAHVDAALADLILACWQADWDTMNSCQEGVDGRVWIQFVFPHDAEQFCTVSAGGYDPDLESLYNRVCGEWEPADWETFRTERAWRYDCGPMDLAAPEYDEATETLRDAMPGTPAEIVLNMSVRFPPSDLAEVTRRVQAHADALADTPAS
jgi:hypothetical protein